MPTPQQEVERLRARETTIVKALEEATGAAIPDGGHYLNDILQRITMLKLSGDAARAEVVRVTTLHEEFTDSIQPGLEEIRTLVEGMLEHD